MATRQNVLSTFVVEASALDAGDVAHSANIPFALAGALPFKGKIVGLSIIDADHNTAANLAGDLWLFKAAVTQPAADAALSISDADMLNFIGIIPIAAGDCLLNAASSACSVRLAAPLQFDLGIGTTIYGVYRVTATPTFGGASLTMVLHVA